MKFFLITFISLISIKTAIGQTKATNKADTTLVPQMNFDTIKNYKNKVVKLGLSLGFSYLPGKLYDASISPIDNTLKLQRQFPANFLISTALVINPKESYDVLVNSKNKTLKMVGEQLRNISFIATINLVSIGSNTETLFNKKIDGGLG